MSPLDPDAFIQALASQLRAEIAAAGLSARAVATTAGMQPVVLGRYLSAERDMPVSVLPRILNAIELLSGVTAMPNTVLRRAEERMASLARPQGPLDRIAEESSRSASDPSRADLAWPADSVTLRPDLAGEVVRDTDPVTGRRTGSRLR